MDHFDLEDVFVRVTNCLKEFQSFHTWTARKIEAENIVVIHRVIPLTAPSIDGELKPPNETPVDVESHGRPSNELVEVKVEPKVLVGPYDVVVHDCNDTKVLCPERSTESTPARVKDVVNANYAEKRGPLARRRGKKGSVIKRKKGHKRKPGRPPRIKSASGKPDESDDDINFCDLDLPDELDAFEGSEDVAFVNGANLAEEREEEEEAAAAAEREDEIVTSARKQRAKERTIARLTKKKATNHPREEAEEEEKEDSSERKDREDDVRADGGRQRSAGRPYKHPELFSVKQSEDGLFHCPQCPGKYAKHVYLYKHFGEVHGKDFECSVCSAKFSSTYKYQHHRDFVHNDGTGKLPCPHCDARFHVKSHVRHHIEVTHPEIRVAGSKERKEEKKCPHCELKFFTQRKQMEHAIECHEEEVYRCRGCAKVFLSEPSLFGHLRSLHPRFLLLCPYCDKPFAVQKSLNYHIDESHEDKSMDVEKPFSCPLVFCQKRFRSECSIAKHSRYHSLRPKKFKNAATTASKRKIPDEKKEKEEGKEEKSQCPTCGELVPTSAMQFHVKKHETVTCVDCGKILPTMKRLREHQLVTHLKIKFRCPVDSCQKIFRERRVLKTHLEVVHGDGTKHQCNMCEKSFSLSFDLKTHVRGVHEGIKAYCAFCGKDFVRPSEKNRHEKQVHGSRASDEKSPGNVLSLTWE